MSLIAKLRTAAQLAGTNALADYGYALRPVGRRSTITGVSFLHDAKVLLKDVPRPLLFDVGANVGQTIWAFLETFPSAQIVSFEPSPRTFPLLSGNYGAHPNVRLEPIALGDAESTMSLHLTPDHCATDSLLRPTWTTASEIVSVRVDTLDHYCATHNISRIDLLKIDAQGFDLNVLRGAEQMLRRKAIRLVTAETNVASLYHDEPPLSALLTYADSLDYRLIGFYDATYVRNELLYVNCCWAAPT
jgi:FkbM family methyltransferase